MIITAELSLYPLHETYGKEILQFIEKFQTVSGIAVEINAMSTLITGDYDKIMELLKKEIKPVFKAMKSVMIIKISNGCLVNEHPE